MKLLKWTLGTLILLGVLLVLGSLLLPARTHVERSITIQRPPAEVFATLNSFRRFNEWSPWFAADPQAKYTYEGPVESVGAGMRWSGNQAVGTGSQRITESQAPTRVVVALDFGGHPSVATYTLAAEGAGATRLTWSFDIEHGYNPMSRWFGLLFDRMMGPDYERGLSKLKSLLETAPPR